MANITKKQIKKELQSIFNVLQELRENAIEDLKNEIEEEIESIEPYENRQELTQQQEERQEWLENVVAALEDIITNIEYGEGDLEGLIEQ